MGDEEQRQQARPSFKTITITQEAGGVPVVTALQNCLRKKTLLL